MKTTDNQPLDNVNAQLHAMVSAQQVRRNVLKGAVTGMVTLSALGTNALIGSKAVFASGFHSKLQDILNIAVTAERLAITTYSNGIANAGTLGISGNDLTYLEAAVVEEQIHELFFESLGAQPLTSTFSYPQGALTFSDFNTFFTVQQLLEGSFDSAFLAGIIEVAQLGNYRLAQILGQIACIEAEHRVLGRVIAGLQPADNYAFAPILVKKVKDAPGILTQAGFLSPVINNSYTYVQVNTSFVGIEYRTPFAI